MAKKTFKGNDRSIMWLLRSFATFSAASGLCLNNSKSEIYFNGVHPEVIANILQVSGIMRGKLPLKYLGVPISAKKLTKNEGMKLTERIVARIRGWGARHLSYAGRLILVNSVLTSLHSYWASIFLISNGIMTKTGAICRNYLWGGKAEYKKAPNVSWDSCCSPKEEGGLGIKEMKYWNKALLGRYAWWITQKKDHLWFKWVNHVYMGLDWKNYTAPPDSSWSWRKIVQVMSIFSQAYTNNKWLNTDKHYTISEGYDWLRMHRSKVDWYHICWNTLNIPITSFIYWAAIQNRLLTKDRMIRMGFQVDPLCDICGFAPENHRHLLYDCEYNRNCWALLQTRLKVNIRMQDLVHWYSKGRGKTKFQRRFIGACHVAIMYFIWQSRNNLRLTTAIRRPEILVEQTLKDVQTRFLRINMSKLSDKDKRWFQSIS